MLKECSEEPTIKELSERLGASCEEVAVAIEACIKPESIYKVINEGDKDGKTLGDMLEGDESCEGRVINKLLVEELLKDLDGRESEIVKRRYFKEQTQSEIARSMGISQVQVSRIEKAVLTRMRNKLLRESL